MAIISKPETISRGTKAEFTLNKADLSSHSKVVASGYFASASVWLAVSLVFKSDTRNQQTVVKFNALESSPKANFFVSQYSVGDFLIDSILINDFDGGTLTIFRSELTPADFDVEF